MRHLMSGLAIFLFLLGSTSIAFADVKIGINAPRGELKALKKWSPLGDYIEEAIGEKVVLVPNKVAKLLQLMKKGEIDFVFANPVQTIIMESEQGANALATLNTKNGPQFAGVIIAKKGSGIKTAADLKGKKVISLSSAAAAAYVFQYYDLLKKGIDPKKDFASFTQGKKLDDLVFAVRAGVMDAAFIKTGVLESMTKEGKIKKDDFVVVDQRQDPNFSLLHTTQTYPNWYFSATQKTKTEMRAKVKKALLELTPDHQVCKTAKVKGFVKALPLDELKDALKTLKLRPYNK